MCVCFKQNSLECKFKKEHFSFSPWQHWESTVQETGKPALVWKLSVTFEHVTCTTGCTKACNTHCANGVTSEGHQQELSRWYSSCCGKGMDEHGKTTAELWCCGARKRWKCDPHDEWISFPLVGTYSFVFGGSHAFRRWPSIPDLLLLELCGSSFGCNWLVGICYSNYLGNHIQVEFHNGFYIGSLEQWLLFMDVFTTLSFFLVWICSCFFSAASIFFVLSCSISTKGAMQISTGFCYVLLLKGQGTITVSYHIIPAKRWWEMLISHSRELNMQKNPSSS